MTARSKQERNAKTREGLREKMKEKEGEGESYVRMKSARNDIQISYPR